MKFLKYIKDKPLPQNKKFERRSATRAILFDENGLIPILFVSKFNYHKLPGGGIEEGEDKMSALAREIFEETGCEAKMEGEIGKITEYRSEFNLFQTSYCYVGKVIKKGKPDFTEDEMGEGFELVWLSLDEAIEEIKNDKTSNYQGGFIQQRDLAFLEEIKRIQS